MRGVSGVLVGVSLLAACARDDGPDGDEKGEVVVPTPGGGYGFVPGPSVAEPSGSVFSFAPLPFDEVPSMLAVVGNRSVYAVLGSENRLWLRTGSHYYEGYRWGAAAKFERDGPAFTALHGYSIPYHPPWPVPPRVYVAESDASLCPVTPEGIGAPVAFCTSASSCRATADVVSVIGPTDARGAVWMLRDPEGIALYLEESPSRFVRSALAPLAGASRVLELVDDPPGVAMVLQRDGAWSLLRLTSDAAGVRDELALPDGYDYVHLARGKALAYGDDAPDALHVLVGGAAGGEAALAIEDAAVSLDWRWRGALSAGASWYGRGYPRSSTAPRDSCYLAGTELVCREQVDREPVRLLGLRAARHYGMHLFALQEEGAGSYIARDVAYYGPSFP